MMFITAILTIADMATLINRGRRISVRQAQLRAQRLYRSCLRVGSSLWLRVREHVAREELHERGNGSVRMLIP